MSHLFQVGAGSGGMLVLDLLFRDPQITAVTLVEPDVYKPHNVHRHFFPTSAVGRLKADLAAEWVRERRPDISVNILPVDLLAPEHQPAIEAAVVACDVAVCAVDNEPAKFHFDSLMRKFGKPWTLGEVLSGGIGGWVHSFKPGGACYGCVASRLQRDLAKTDRPPAEYNDPNAPVVEATIPASKASISAIASLHALRTRSLIGDISLGDGEYTSLLWTLARVDGLFTEAFRPHRLAVERSRECLICGQPANAPTGGDLDVALDEALARLGDQ